MDGVMNKTGEIAYDAEANIELSSCKKKCVYLGIVYISIRSKQKPLNYQQILRKIKSPNESADCKSDQLNLFCLCGDYY